MLSRKLVLALVLLFAFGIVESRIKKPPAMSKEEFEEYKKQHPEIDWEEARVDTFVGPKPWKAKAIPGAMPDISKDKGPTMHKPEFEPEPQPTWPIYNGLGVPYEEARGQTNSPIMVTDTVRCSGGFGVLDLNAQLGRGRLPVIPSSSEDIHVLGVVPIITDSTQSVPTYGAWINRELNQLNIQSSDASDTRLVQVSFMVQ